MKFLTQLYNVCSRLQYKYVRMTEDRAYDGETAMELNLSAYVLLISVSLSFVASEQNLTEAIHRDGAQKRSLTKCLHNDYRSYIKCLQRHKRHHEPQEIGDSDSCLEQCGIEQCQTQMCNDHCYSRCFKKTKEIHLITKEYENDCNSRGDCDRGKGIANITTSIDIKNYINNTNVIAIGKDLTGDREGGKGEGGHDGSNDQTNAGHDVGTSNRSDSDGSAFDNKNSHKSNPGLNNSGHHNPRGGGTNTGGHVGNTAGLPTKDTDTSGGNNNKWGSLNPWYPWGGLTVIPQIQMVPQITFGLGLGPIGGCAFGASWLCLQQTQAVDCSGCGDPYLRYRCDVSCYRLQRTSSQDVVTRTDEKTTCKYPHCMGGVG